MKLTPCKELAMYRSKEHYIKQINSEIDTAFSEPGSSLEKIKSVVLEKVNHLYEEQYFIAEILADLYQIKDWDTAIKTVLAKTGDYLNVSRIFIMEMHTTTNNLVLEYVWHKEEYPSQMGAIVPQHISDHMYEYLSTHSHYYINDINSITGEYAKYLQALDIKACLIFPIKMHDEIYGFIGIDQCSGHRDWSEDEVNMIRMMSDIMSHAILQKLTQIDLKHSNALLTEVLDNIHAIIVVVDPETNRIMYLNKYSKNVFGDVVGELCWEQLHGDLSSQCANCPRPGTGDYKNQTVVTEEIQNSYWKRWYHTTNTIIDWKDGKKGHLEIAIDITDRKEAENQMRLTTERLEELNRTKDKFLSIVAHDLKNPLYSLMGFAEIMRSRSYQLTLEEITEYSDLIYQSARNTHQLLQNLLVWSQSQTGKLKFYPIPTEIVQVIENTIEFTKPIAKQKNISITKEYLVTPVQNVDPNMLTTTLRNILSNAVKFTQIDGNIHIKLYNTENNTCIDVQDNGVGMTDEDISKLFKIEVDHRSIGKNLGDSKGTGLGLILAKEFMTQHHGFIKVQSIPDEGSTFTLCLPKAAEPEA